MTVRADDVLAVAASHHGHPYSWINRFGPQNYDCSGHVWRSVVDAGLAPSFPASSWTQARYCRDAGTLISLRQAVNTPGALLFHGPNGGYDGYGADGHVAFVWRAGWTSEARGRRYGVGSWPIDRPLAWWSNAALIPGVTYPTGPAAAAPTLKGPADMAFVPRNAKRNSNSRYPYVDLSQDGGKYLVTTIGLQTRRKADQHLNAWDPFFQVFLNPTTLNGPRLGVSERPDGTGCVVLYADGGTEDFDYVWDPK